MSGIGFASHQASHHLPRVVQHCILRKHKQHTFSCFFFLLTNGFQSLLSSDLLLLLTQQCQKSHDRSLYIVGCDVRCGKKNSAPKMPCVVPAFNRSFSHSLIIHGGNSQ